MVNKELYFYYPTFTYIGNCVEILHSRTENTCSKPDGKHGVEHTAPFSAFSERLPVESETKTYGAILRESALCSLRQGSLAPHFAQFANKDAATWTCTG